MARGSFKFTLHGAKELENAFRQLPKAVGKSVLRSSLMKAGRPIASYASANAARRTGGLASSLRVTTVLRKRQKRGRTKRGAVEVFIGASWPTGAHAHLIEFGTRFMAARPFMRPAWDAGKAGALKTLRRDIWKSLQKAARRLAKQATSGKISARNARDLLG